MMGKMMMMNDDDSDNDDEAARMIWVIVSAQCDRALIQMIVTVSVPNCQGNYICVAKENDNDGYDDDLTDITSIESEESDDEQEDDDTCDEINYVWYVMYQSCDVKNGEHFIEACAGYLGLYAISKDYVLFKSIMDDAARLEVDGMEFEKALASSILKHKLSIISKVNRCKLDGKDDDKGKLSESEDEDDDDDDDGDELKTYDDHWVYKANS